MALRTRNAVLRFNIESSEGVEEAPAASDSIRVEVDFPSFDNRIGQTNEASGSLDRSQPYNGGTTVNIPFSVPLKGSGSAGTAPEFGELLKAVGFAEVVTSTAVPASAEACGAGGSTTTAELGASAGTTDQQYRGMPINISSGVTLSTFIGNYVGSTKIAILTDTASGTINAGSNYQIPVNVLYKPASSSIPSLTCYFYMDGLLYKFVGCRGGVNLSLPNNDIGRLNFTMSGIFLSKTDVAVPTDSTFDDVRAPVFKDAVCKYDRVAMGLSRLNVDLGNAVVYPPNPNGAEGVDPPIITERNLSFDIDPNTTLSATRDFLANLRAGDEKILHARLGSTAGNRIGITLPKAHITGFGPGDREGVMIENITGQAGTGQDDSAFLCFY